MSEAAVVGGFTVRNVLTEICLDFALFLSLRFTPLLSLSRVCHVFLCSPSVTIKNQLLLSHILRVGKWLQGKSSQLLKFTSES